MFDNSYVKSALDPNKNAFFGTNDAWQEREEEGQLSVDVLQTTEEVILMAAMAGTKPEDLSLHLQDDLITIRGRRSFPLGEEKAEYFYQECFWGKFSRTIVLPVEVREESAQAEYRNGVLIIRLQKAKSDNIIPLVIIEE